MWVDTNAIKNFKVFKVNLGESFNVEELSKGYKYKDIQFIYAYEKVDAISYEWDSTLVLNGVYPNYFFTAGINVTNNSIINVLIVEGDKNNPSVTEDAKSGEWVTMSVLSKIAIFKLNKGNNYTINLDLDLKKGRWTKGKYSIIPMVSHMEFTEYDRGYDISLTNIGGNKYTSSLENWSFKDWNFVDNFSSDRSLQTIPLRDDCVFVSCFQQGGADDHSIYLKMWIDNSLIYDVHTYASNEGVPYTYYKPYGKQSSISFRCDGDPAYYSYRVRQHLVTYSQVEKYELTCIIVEEV